MAVNVVKKENRSKIAQEHDANLKDWVTLAPSDRSNIIGELPEWDREPKKNSEGRTKTAQRHQNKFEGKHNPPAHKRVSSRPPRPKGDGSNEVCSTCGAKNATIIFNQGQYHSMHCIPTHGSNAGPSRR